MKNREIRYFLVRIPGIGPQNLQERVSLKIACILISSNAVSVKFPGSRHPDVVAHGYFGKVDGDSDIEASESRSWVDLFVGVLS